MKNIETFNIFVADILSHLYQSFPVPCDMESDETMTRVENSLKKLYPEGVVKTDMETWWVASPNEDLVGKISLCEFWEETVNWLQQSGYLTAEQGESHYFLTMVLTAKGLEALNATIDALDPDRTIGTVLSDAATSGSKEAGKTIVSKGVEMLLGLGIKMLAT